MRCTRFTVFTIFAPLLFSLYGIAQAKQTVDIDHRTGIQDPEGSIQLEQGEELTINIIHTFQECFKYNFEAVPVTPPKSAIQGDTPPPPLQEKTVTFHVNHDRSFGSYKITITKKDDLTGTLKTQCDAVSPQKPDTYTVTVGTYGWTLGFAGAFTADKLTDPVFSLHPGTQQGADGQPTKGYFVEKNKGAEDSFRLGSAAMIHLYHSNPNRLKFLGIRHYDIYWAPLSFGLGINGGSQAHYFLGTSVKFGDQAFLTVGGVFGPRKRLPDGITNFTTDQNALSSLPTKNGSALFVGISYTFISVSKDTFQSLFKEKTPAAPSQGSGQ